MYKKVKVFKQRNNNNFMGDKILLFFILSIIMLTSINASLGNYKLGEIVPIRVLANCSSINITEVNGITINQQMLFLGGQTFIYNYTSNKLGTNSYSWNNPCIDCSTGECGNSFEVTPSGALQTTAQGINSLGIILLVLILMIIFGLVGWKLINNDLFLPAGIFSIVLALILLVYNVWLLYEFKLNYTGSTPDASVAMIIFYIFMTVLGAGLITAFALLFTKWKEFKAWIKQALTKQEDDEKDDLI